jgi:hypothetical protein
VLLPCHASAPLVPVSLTFPLVQNSPIRSGGVEMGKSSRGFHIFTPYSVVTLSTAPDGSTAYD